MSSSELAHATLSITNVTLFRANKLIFKNLNLNISSGDICILNGPNGAGKTSLLRIIAGYLPISNGKMSLNGHIFEPLKSHLPIWYIGHPFGFHPNLSAAKNLSQIASMRKLSMFDEDRFNVIDFFQQPIRTLSTGQIQRLALSQLLLKSNRQKEALWLLDEPNSALDSLHCLALETLIEEHIEFGGRVIVAAHQPLCEHLSPQIIQLEAKT